MGVKRTHYSQLPNKNEIDLMIKKQSSRFPTEEKWHEHYTDFSSVVDWLKVLNLDIKTFVEYKDSKSILESSEKTKPVLIEKTIKNHKEKKVKHALDKVTQYLGQQDKLKKVDFIIVFGSLNKNRALKAANLYKKGYAKKLLITGGNPNYDETRLPEAVTYSRIAINRGVPKDKIVIEPNSINFVDNVSTSLNLLDNLGVKYKSLISITTWHTQRRAWCHLNKLSPNDTEIIRCNAISSDNKINKNTWYTNELGISAVFNEFVKMRVSVYKNNVA